MMHVDIIGQRSSNDGGHKRLADEVILFAIGPPRGHANGWLKNPLKADELLSTDTIHKFLF